MSSERNSKDALEFIAASSNKIKVYYDRAASHAATHLADTAGLRDLVIEIITSLELHGQEVDKHFDMGRVVGTCDVVMRQSTDTIVYAMRKNREDDGLVPWTTSRSVGDPMSNVAVHLVPQTDGTYHLMSCWIGRFDPDDDQPFPQSPHATPKSAAYWDKRAFIWGSQEIIERTETSICPW